MSKHPEDMNMNNYAAPFANFTSTKEMIKALAPILKQPSSMRTTEDYEVFKAFSQHNIFFQKCLKRGEEFYTHLFENLEYKSSQSGETLFEAGSIGSTFYIILSGWVEVCIKVATLTDLGLQIGLKKVQELKAGSSFGELALLEETLKPRAATITCRGDCHFATLEWKPFRKLFGDDQRRKIEGSINFLVNIPIFKGISRHNMKTWAYLFQRKTIYRKNQTIYTENEDPENIYIIRSGQVVCKKLIYLSLPIEDKSDAIVGDQNQFYLIEKPSQFKSVDFLVLGAGEMFGEEEAFASYRIESKTQKKMNFQHIIKIEPRKVADNEEREKLLDNLPIKRTMTIIVSSPTAEIWSAPKKYFFPKMETSSMTMKNLVDTLIVKKELREKRKIEIQKSLSEHHNYVKKEAVGPVFKKDIMATIIQKNFMKNGGANLRQFLEKRCSTPHSPQYRQEQDPQNSKESPSLIFEKSEIPLSLNEVGERTNREISLFYPQRGDSRSLPKKYGKNESESREQESMLNLSPIQARFSRFTFRDTELELPEMKSEKNVDKIPSLTKYGSKKFNESKPGSLILNSPTKTRFQVHDENPILSYLRQNIVAKLETSKKAISSVFEKEVPSKNSSPKKKIALEPTEYLSSRERPSTPHYLSTHLEVHLKRKNLYLTNGLSVKAPPSNQAKSPRKSNANISSPNKTSFLLNKTMSPKTNSQIQMNNLRATENFGNFCKEMNASPQKSLRTSRNPSTTRNKVNQSLDLKDQSHESLSARGVRSRSKLFNQALKETYGRRLYKMSKTFMQRNEA